MDDREAFELGISPEMASIMKHNENSALRSENTILRASAAEARRNHEAIEARLKVEISDLRAQLAAAERERDEAIETNAVNASYCDMALSAVEQLDSTLAAQSAVLAKAKEAVEEAGPLLTYFYTGATSFSGTGTPLTASIKCHEALTAINNLTKAPPT